MASVSGHNSSREVTTRPSKKLGFLKVPGTVQRFIKSLVPSREHSRYNLMELYSRSNIEGIQKVMTKHPETVNACVDRDGNTLLIVASGKGNVPLVTWLLKMPGIDLDAQNRFGWTALYEAVAHSQLEVLRMLLNAGACPTICATCFPRQSPLLMARQLERHEPARILEAVERVLMLLRVRALTGAAKLAASSCSPSYLEAPETPSMSKVIAGMGIAEASSTCTSTLTNLSGHTSTSCSCDTSELECDSALRGAEWVNGSGSGSGAGAGQGSSSSSTSTSLAGVGVGQHDGDTPLPSSSSLNADTLPLHHHHQGHANANGNGLQRVSSEDANDDRVFMSPSPSLAMDLTSTSGPDLNLNTPPWLASRCACGLPSPSVVITWPPPAPETAEADADDPQANGQGEYEGEGVGWDAAVVVAAAEYVATRMRDDAFAEMYAMMLQM